MSTSGKQFTAAAARVIATETISIDGNRVRAASVIQTSGGNSAADAWVELGIMSGGPSQGNRSLILAQNYVGDGSGVSWVGEISGHGEDYLYANVWSTLGGTFKLSIITEAGA